MLTQKEFWQFSLDYYSKADIQQAALQLQDQYEVNINLLILLYWADQQELRLPLKHLELAITQHQASLEKCRGIRRNLKTKVPREDYQAILNLELELEKLQQNDLIAALAKYKPKSGTDNLKDYLNSKGVTQIGSWLRRLQG